MADEKQPTQPPTLLSEAKMIGRVAKLLEKMPRSAQLRILGYIVSRVLSVGTCEVTETLYRLAQVAREEEEAVQ